MVAHYNEQFHHNHPSLLTDQLYLSAARALSSSVLLDLGITCVINATLELPTVAYQKQESMQIAVEDCVSTKLYMYFDLVADKINSVHRSGGKMIVYCRAGMSRSAALCIAYFMKYHGMSVDDAFQYVRERRPVIHPNLGFMRQLRDYEKKLRAKESQPFLHEFGDTLDSSRPMPDLLYATEVTEANDDLMLELSEIQPRPKPRIPKFKSVDMKLSSAQVFIVPTAFHGVPLLDDSLPPPPPTKRARKKSKKFPPGTPSLSASPSTTHLKSLSPQMAEGLNATDVRSDTPLLEFTPTHTPFTRSPSASFKKKLQLNKLAEPAKIAQNRTASWLKSLRKSLQSVQSVVLQKL